MAAIEVVFPRGCATKTAVCWRSRRGRCRRRQQQTERHRWKHREMRPDVDVGWVLPLSLTRGQPSHSHCAAPSRRWACGRLEQCGASVLCVRTSGCWSAKEARLLLPRPTGRGDGAIKAPVDRRVGPVSAAVPDAQQASSASTELLAAARCRIGGDTLPTKMQQPWRLGVSLQHRSAGPQTADESTALDT